MVLRPREVGGENCQWQFARKSSSTSYACKREVSGPPKVAESCLSAAKLILPLLFQQGILLPIISKVLVDSSSARCLDIYVAHYRNRAPEGVITVKQARALIDLMTIMKNKQALTT